MRVCSKVLVSRFHKIVSHSQREDIQKRVFVRCLHRTHSKRSHALGETDRESQRASEREREQRIIIGAIAIARRMSPSCSTSRIANARKMVHLLENNDFASGACGVRGGALEYVRALARSLAACARAWTQHSSIKTVRTRYLCRNDTNILFLFGRARSHLSSVPGCVRKCSRARARVTATPCRSVTSYI